VCSSVCTKLGFIASFKSTVKLPSAFKSFAVIGLFSSLYPIIIFPNLLFKSVISFDKQSIAIISDATVILNPSILGTTFFSSERPVFTTLNCLSFKSKHLFQDTLLIPSSFPKYIWLSIIAESKLFAVVIAWISPVKWRLISSIGAICEWPPPVAPPFIPNTGPNDGSLKANIDFLPIFLNPSANPIDIVVFPSPSGVGFIAVTNTSLPSFLSFKFW